MDKHSHRLTFYLNIKWSINHQDFIEANLTSFFIHSAMLHSYGHISKDCNWLCRQMILWYFSLRTNDFIDCFINYLHLFLSLQVNYHLHPYRWLHCYELWEIWKLRVVFVQLYVFIKSIRLIFSLSKEIMHFYKCCFLFCTSKIGWLLKLTGSRGAGGSRSMTKLRLFFILR